MALLKCRECGKEISEYAKNCPYCGSPNFIRMEKECIRKHEQDRKRDIEKNIEYYQMEFVKSLILLTISLFVDMFFFYGNLSMVGIDLITSITVCFWLKLLIPIWWRWFKDWEDILDLFIRLLVMLFVLDFFRIYLKGFNEWSLLLMPYPLYCAFIKPVIAIKRINEEKAKV